MSNEIFDSLVQLYNDALNSEEVAFYLDSNVYGTFGNETVAWIFSSINIYQNRACTITVHVEPISHYVSTVIIEYDNKTVCVWVAPEDPTTDYFKKYCDSDVLEDDFNIVMAVARDGFFDSGKKMEENLDDDDEVNEDGTVNIPLDLTDSELALIARAAHAQDITINEFMNQAVTEMLAEMGIDE